MSKKLYSVNGIFDSPDAIIHAANKVSKEGYKDYDVHTPYPIHGMDDAMEIPPSKLSYFTIALGMTGMIAIISFIYWTMTVNYPQVIGGKPTFSLPAFIPVMFESTVLLGAVGTVACMIIFYFKFPNHSHPLHDTPYMKDVSSDKYGVCIEAKDSKFDIESVKALYQSLGASRIEEVYFDEEEVNTKERFFEPKFVIGMIAIAIFTSISVYGHMNKLLFIVPFDWMMHQSRLPAQQSSDFFADGFGMRPPVEGTVARGFMPYPYVGQPDSAAKYLSNPLETNEKNLALGKAKFETFCSPCHGNYGTGESRLKDSTGNQIFPVGPNLHSEKVTNWPDGRIYHIITDGQNIMQSYDRQMLSKEKWAVVLYIRSLQRAMNAQEGDLK